MDTEKRVHTLLLIYSFCVAVLFVSFMPMVSFAEELPEAWGMLDSEITEIEQDTQTETADPSRSEATEAIELVQDEQNSIDFEPDTNELEPPGLYEQFEIEYDEGTEYIPNINSDYEILMTLKSIEYQLKIIAGGMVLALISLFIWFTILKPIKTFTRV